MGEFESLINTVEKNEGISRDEAIKLVVKLINSKQTSLPKDETVIGQDIRFYLS
ncbi:hypothetical protein [Proteus penneri]|uniref:hypothetical protein n=1 Tax=Proteus penneri TaxID=102862 RepID=UPI002889968F|nr:hypothetical protein [Proteus penneri]